MQHDAPTPYAMMDLGAKFAQTASQGDVFALVGGLGAGKTHWTKGFVRHFGSHSDVTSPTFGLLHEYTDGSTPIFHLDFYRMESADELLGLGWDELLDQPAILIVEWADRFPDLLPPHARWLEFSINHDHSRTIRDSPASR